MRLGLRRSVGGAFAALTIGMVTVAVHANNTAQTLPFSQNWTNVGLITLADDWSGVPGIEGHIGDGLTGGTGTDPRTILGFGSGTLDVIANQTNTAITNGGIAEFDGIANPVVALQGSGGASAPFLLVHLDTSGFEDISVSYNVRDIDGSADNAIQQVNLQYRVGNTGNFTNVTGGYIADATTGPSLATLVTPVSATLPAAADNQPLVQIRIMTTNAVGNDEWVGIDDINVSGVLLGGPTGIGLADPATVVDGGNTLLTVQATPGLPPNNAITLVIGDLTAIGQTNAQLFFDDGSNGDVTPGDNTFSVETSVAPGTVAGQKTLPTTITDAAGRTGNAPITVTVVNQTAPSGVGAASPSSVNAGDNTLLTVAVTPGTNPPSTGLTVIGDLTEIGQTNAQLFFDDGSNGDVTPGDNTFSVLTSVAPATTAGNKTVPTSITDDQGRAGSAPISISVGAALPQVVISQVYGGGGEAGASFRNDFIEIFNRGTTSADMNGWSVQYASATGTTWSVTPLSGTIPPGRYYLVHQASAGSSGPGLPAADATGGVDIDFAAGKVLLIRSTTAETDACPGSGDIADLVGYGAADCFEGAGPAPSGGVPTADVRLVHGCSDQDNNAADFARQVPGPRNSASAAVDCTNPPPSGAPLLAINQVQGSGSASPVDGQVVRVRGVVTGRTNNLFYMQTPDGGVDDDGNPLTSEGLLAFTGTAPTVVAGDFVEVTGTIDEFIPGADPVSPPKTEILPVSITRFSGGNPLPAPVTITAADTTPEGGFEQLEHLEGMRVRVNLRTITGTGGNVSEPNATGTTNGLFYGVVDGVDRPFREPGIEILNTLPPGAPPGVPRFDGNPERLRVDTDVQPGALPINLSSGTLLTDLIGPLDYSFRVYSISPDPLSPPTVSGGSTAGPVPAPTADQFTVASYNIERFFDTVNDPGIGEPVLTATAFNNRLNKVSLGIRNVLLTPDIIGLQEVENLTTLQAVATKINNDAVAASQPNPMYQPFLVEGNDVGGIDVGFLVKAARVNVVDVTQEGKTTTYTNPETQAQDLLNDRPSLVLRATVQRASGPALPVTVIVNHLRSLSGVEDPADGNRIRTKRQKQAEFLANLVQARQVANPSERIIVIGDLNAFGFNDGLVDSVGTIRGVPTPADEVVLASPDLVNPDLISLETLVPEEERYSFLFDGNAQELDHALVTQNTFGLVAGVARGRGNSDSPEVFRSDPNRPERLADHDPLVAYFNFPTGTSTTLQSSLNPSQFGQSVTFTATVSSAGGPVTTGDVAFRDGLQTLGTVAVDANGLAAFTTAALTAGSHSITAEYLGSGTLAASADVLTQQVTTATTTTTLASSPNPSGFNQPVTFTATVGSASGPAAQGSVTFFEGSTQLGGPVTVDAKGQASFTISTLAMGLHTITAQYSGTSSLAASSGGATHTVQAGVAITDVFVAEGNTPSTVAVVFNVSLSAAAAQTVTVPFSTQNGTATAGSDYVAASGQLVFPIGTTSRTVAVIVLSDTANEADESFTLALGAATNAVVVDGAGVGNILNDDPLPSLVISDTALREGNAGTTMAVFTVRLSTASGRDVGVSFTTSDGSATAPEDYNAASGTLAFPAGTLTQTISVPVNGDTTMEQAETFLVILQGVVNAVVADSLGIGTIRNDDVSRPMPPRPPGIRR